MARAIMFQGTGSDVGKSLVVAGIARALTRRGLRVRPFKPQNMSNNAAVTEDGGEIGRAQALQARACGVRPSVHMNPILLKPQSDMGSQVIVQGRVFGKAKARDYYTLKPQLLPKALESFQLLAEDADIVLVEGAGSPAEINLRDGDIANMGFAEAAGIPVVLVADIDRGGVIASVVGTCAVLQPEERARLVGFLINKFRGDPTLFDSGMKAIEDRSGLPGLGLIGWFAQAGRLPAEDAVALEKKEPAPDGNGKKANGKVRNAKIVIAVPRLGRIANFDDLDPLRAEEDVEVRIVDPGNPLPADADIVLLPGSKTTIPDLVALKQEGWDIDIKAHVRRGGTVVGICAGFQMLGRSLADPKGHEGKPGSVEGLGLLDVETVLSDEKSLVECGGVDLASGVAVDGYEMHMGRSEGMGLSRPMLELGGRPDGAVSPDGRIMGCYLHGLFASDAFRHAFLSRFREGRSSDIAYEAMVEETLNALAEHMERHVDIDRLLALSAEPDMKGM